MPDAISEEFYNWMDKFSIDRTEIATLMGVDKDTLSVYRSRGLPKKKLALAQRLMREHSHSAAPVPLPPPTPDNLVRLDLSNEEFDLINRASKIVDTEMKPFILKAATAKAREEIAMEKRSDLKVAEDSTPYRTGGKDDKKKDQ